MSYNILPNLRVQTDLDLATCTIKDRNNSVGTNGQSLTKDNIGLLWNTVTAALPDPINTNISMVGPKTFTDRSGSTGSPLKFITNDGIGLVWDNISNAALPTTINQNLSLVGPKSFTDYMGSTGTNGQVLMRDATGPMWMNHTMGSAEIYWSTNFGAVAEYLTSGIGTAGTPGGAVLVPTTTLTTSYSFDMPSNGRLRYTGTPTVHCHVAFSLSVRGNAASAKDIRFYLKKTGTTVTGSGYRFTVKSTSEYQTIAAHKILDLATNDYLEIWCQNVTDATELNIQNFNLQLMFSD